MAWKAQPDGTCGLLEPAWLKFQVPPAIRRQKVGESAFRELSHVKKQLEDPRKQGDRDLSAARAGTN